MVKQKKKVQRIVVQTNRYFLTVEKVFGKYKIGSRTATAL